MLHRYGIRWKYWYNWIIMGNLIVFFLKTASIMSATKGQLNDFGLKSGCFLDCNWNIVVAIVWFNLFLWKVFVLFPLIFSRFHSLYPLHDPNFIFTCSILEDKLNTMYDSGKDVTQK